MEKLVGLLVPPLIDLINRRVGDSDLRFWISVAVCALVGTGLDYLDGGFAGVEPWAETVLVVFGLAQLSYKAFYENSEIRGDLGLDAERN